MISFWFYKVMGYTVKSTKRSVWMLCIIVREEGRVMGGEKMTVAERC
jgi:hypothetical protein